MSNILNRIGVYSNEYYPVKSRPLMAEICDHETGECTYVPGHCAFPAMVMAIKDCHHRGHVSIVHDRDPLIRADGEEEVYYSEYALGSDGYVHRVGGHGDYTLYNECCKA